MAGTRTCPWFPENMCGLLFDPSLARSVCFACLSVFRGNFATHADLFEPAGSDCTVTTTSASTMVLDYRSRSSGSNSKLVAITTATTGIRIITTPPAAAAAAAAAAASTTQNNNVAATAAAAAAAAAATDCYCYYHCQCKYLQRLQSQLLTISFAGTDSPIQASFGERGPSVVGSGVPKEQLVLKISKDADECFGSLFHPFLIPHPFCIRWPSVGLCTTIRSPLPLWLVSVVRPQVLVLPCWMIEDITYHMNLAWL